MSDNGPCTICRGEYSEHFDSEGKQTTQHVYTTTPGDLKTPEKPQPQGQRVQVTPGMLGGGNDAVGRLVEILLQRRLIDTPDALYVAGMGSKPMFSVPSAPPSGVEFTEGGKPVYPEGHPFRRGGN